ncbi:MAG: DUF1287 domain-containing protein, partial [Hymenobacter sp.]
SGHDESARSYVPENISPKREQISNAALSLTEDRVDYDPSYFSIAYPGGDVPKNKGVCTDVVIRTYRKIGTDLQKLVHEDINSRWQDYPHLWGLPGPDKNIDHRRVPNLMEFFSRHAEVREVGTNGKAYLPGDVVAWRLQNGRTHIGIVVNRRSNDGERNLMVHNIGAGQVLEDCLFNFQVIGHYYFEGKR